MSTYQAAHAPIAPGLGTELRAAAAYAIAAALALLLQTTILHVLTGGRAIPDLVLILCVYLGLREHSVGGAAGAFLLGYLLDSFSGSLVGLNAFAMTSVYLVVYLVARRLWMDNVVTSVIVVFFAALFKGLVIAGALAAYLSVDRLSVGVAELLLAEALLAAALTPTVFIAVDWQRRVLGAV